MKTNWTISKCTHDLLSKQVNITLNSDEGRFIVLAFTLDAKGQASDEVQAKLAFREAARLLDEASKSDALK